MILNKAPIGASASFQGANISSRAPELKTYTK